MASGPITSWQTDGETMETMTDFILGDSKITADGGCSHEIKRHLLLGRKTMTNLGSILKSRDITLPTKVHLVKAMVSPVVMYGCESWTIKKIESWKTDAFELWWAWVWASSRSWWWTVQEAWHVAVHRVSKSQTWLSNWTKLNWTVTCQAPLSMGFSRQKYWSGLPWPPPGDLPNPGIESESLMSPALTGGFFTTSPIWRALESLSSSYFFHHFVQWYWKQSANFIILVSLPKMLGNVRCTVTHIFSSCK